MQTLNSIEVAKEYAINATNRRLTEEECRKRLADFREYLGNARLESDIATWQEQICALEEWLESPEFKTGAFPAGIDAMIFEMIDWRASVNAFQHVGLEKTPFRTSLFFAQWLSGAAYSILCNLGKLTSKDERDNSLRQVWEQVNGFMVQDGACSREEAEALTKKLHHTDGHFTNVNSKAIRLRNKSIAHNESSIAIEWGHLDADIQILVRMWALVVGFCSMGLIAPFDPLSSAFAGLGEAVSPDELKRLHEKRKEYLDKVLLWTRTHTVSGQVEARSPAVATISIQTKLMRPTPKAAV